MSIKSSVKEHFTSNLFKGHLEGSSLKSHWDYFFQNESGNEISQEFNELSFRKFTRQDLDECALLFKKVFSDDPWYDEWVSWEQSRKYLKELVENPVFEGFVMGYDSKIVAVCLGHQRSWWRGKEFFVDELFVETEMQGNGIGGATVNLLFKVLREEGYTRVILLTNKGIPAETFYLRNGFYNNENWTIMVRKL